MGTALAWTKPPDSVIGLSSSGMSFVAEFSPQVLLDLESIGLKDQRRAGSRPRQ
jgi:hypothetical protein